jgi:hypothetical protein
MKHSPTPIDRSWIEDVLEYLFALALIVLFVAVFIARGG